MKNFWMHICNEMGFHHATSIRITRSSRSHHMGLRCGWIIDHLAAACEPPRPTETLPAIIIINNSLLSVASQFSIYLMLNKLLMVLITAVTLKLNAMAFLARSDEAYTCPSLGILDSEYRQNKKCLVLVEDFCR